MVKVAHRVAALCKFQLEATIAVASTLMAVFNVGEVGIGIMVKPRHPTISELGTVVNNPANSAIMVVLTKLYSY